MERDLNNDEFELFLKQKVDQHKLYPTDKAWEGIYNTLHPGMRWFKIGGSLLVVTALYFFFQQTTILNSSNSTLPSKKVNNTVAVPSPSSKKTFDASVSFLPNKGISNFNTPKAIGEKDAVVQVNNSFVGLEKSSFEQSDRLKGYFLHHNQILKQNSPIIISLPRTTSDIAQSIKNTDAGDSEKELKMTLVKDNDLIKEEIISIMDANWLQELAVIKLTPKKKNKFNLQFYFSPTVSYRRLADNQNSYKTSPQNSPIASRDLDINQYVAHSPSIGAEVGSNILYSVTRNLTIKSGLQLNYSRYNIKAFKFYNEKASIALNGYGPIADTLSSYTSIRNFSGYSPEQLQNQYMQISMPLGAELKLLGNKRLQVNVAGTIQPTLLLFSDSYLLSSNYLHYVKEPSLVRKWNMHSSFEAFLSYKTGDLRWQLGPQFRYQLMSSFNNRYPIKEYLFEYGVKIGVSKTLR